MRASTHVTVSNALLRRSRLNDPGCNVDHPEPLLLRPLLAVLLVGVDVAGVVAGTHALRSQRVLRVCADPNNLPFSNEREEGPENGLAALVAEELDARVEYTWWAQRRGLVPTRCART
jgi:hypothetical protein